MEETKNIEIERRNKSYILSSLLLKIDKLSKNKDVSQDFILELKGYINQKLSDVNSE